MNRTKSIDLHVHTNASDGTLSPEAVVARGKAAGITLMAVTDHDTMDGVVCAQQAGEELGVQVVAGIELSADYNGRDTHVLGYGLDLHEESLQKMLAWIVAERDARNEKIAALMRKDGIDVSVEELRKKYPGAVLGRPHFGRCLVEQGRAATVPEAFENWLNTGKPYYLPRNHVPIADAVDIIRRSGGIPVLAHPLQYKYSGEKLRALVSRAAQLQMAGMEIYYTGYTADDHDKLSVLAEEFHLFVTGGSDFHGDNKPEIRMGELEMPRSVGERLLRRLKG